MKITIYDQSSNREIDDDVFILDGHNILKGFISGIRTLENNKFIEVDYTVSVGSRDGIKISYKRSSSFVFDSIDNLIASLRNSYQNNHA